MERDVLVVGEALVDIVHAADGSTREYAGGSAANVSVALARLGRSVRFATAWADDDRGRVLAEHLDSAGVVLAGDPHALARTATAAATIGADGAASYVFDLEWRINEVTPGAPAFVHLCSLGAVLEPGADQARDHRHRRGSGGPGGADGSDRGPGEGLGRGPRQPLPGSRAGGGGRAPAR